jgi:hypothetical protein
VNRLVHAYEHSQSFILFQVGFKLRPWHTKASGPFWLWPTPLMMPMILRLR